jgi:hypothetical protein
MELITLYKRVIGLDIHQAQITACALIEEGGSTRIEQWQFGGVKQDRRELAEWVVSLRRPYYRCAGSPLVRFTAFLR